METIMRPVSRDDLQDGHPLLDLLPDPVVGVDSNRRVVLWNEAAAAAYGFTRQEALGQLADELLHTRYTSSLIGILDELADSRVWSGEVSHRDKGGFVHVVQEHWVACHDSAGRMSGTMSVERRVGASSLADGAGATVISRHNGRPGGGEMETDSRSLAGEDRETVLVAPLVTGLPDEYSPEILIVDDDSGLRAWTQRTLGAQNYLCATAPDAETARAQLASGSFDLALLDVNLPGESGIELLRHLRIDHPEVAALMVTGEDDLALASTAIELGAHGYLVKPVRAGELVINVVNVLHRRRREVELRRRVERLQGSSERRIGAVRGAITAVGLEPDVVGALQGDAVRRLVRLAEIRDDETGKHMMRMGRYCELVALRHGMPEARADQLGLASELHDIGKVAIPDRILRKPGRLTAAEFDVMKTHAAVGHELLGDADSELMQVAATVALTHHERWDGSGYPAGLAGEEIPLVGRIAAVADVFDALTSDRIYRPAFPVGLAVDMMEEQRGSHFDAELLDALRGTFDQIERVRRRNAD
jgi:putative two-component system response regulator